MTEATAAGRLHPAQPGEKITRDGKIPLTPYCSTGWIMAGASLMSVEPDTDELARQPNLNIRQPRMESSLMVLRLSVIGMLGLFMALGSGCNPCCSEGASATKHGADGVTSLAAGEAKANAEPVQTEKAAKTKEITVAVTGMS